MESEALSIVLVAPEKDLKAMAGALKSLSRKIPLKMHYATQAIEGPAAFNRVYEQTGKLDACFFHSRFTAPGKEPYSEVLGKTLKRKFASTPIIGFGKKSKAGSRGKHYHEFLETDDEIDPRELLEILMRLQDGDIQTARSKKEYRRLSMEEADSTQGESARKKSQEGHEQRAFPRNSSFRKPSWTGGPFSQPGSPGSPFYNNASAFKAESPPANYMNQNVNAFRSGPQTPTGIRTPTSSCSPSSQLMVNGSPNAELIHQLSQELEKLKSLIFEKKMKDGGLAEPTRHLEVRTHDY